MLVAAVTTEISLAPKVFGVGLCMCSWLSSRFSFAVSASVPFAVSNASASVLLVDLDLVPAPTLQKKTPEMTGNAAQRHMAAAMALSKLLPSLLIPPQMIMVSSSISNPCQKDVKIGRAHV
jgi:hypothetical protein